MTVEDLRVRTLTGSEQRGRLLLGEFESGPSVGSSAPPDEVTFGVRVVVAQTAHFKLNISYSESSCRFMVQRVRWQDMPRRRCGMMRRHDVTLGSSFSKLTLQFNGRSNGTSEQIAVL